MMLVTVMVKERGTVGEISIVMVGMMMMMTTTKAIVKAMA
jgi:hypothetical protein